MKLKIGQEVEFIENFEIETYINKTKLQVKKGDKALVTKCGFKILTGECRGKITSFVGNGEPKGFDYENISKLILNRLNSVFGLESYMDDEEIEPKEFLDEIEDVLTDIL